MNSGKPDPRALLELPDYRVRKSARAKRAQIKVNAYGEIEVVLPCRIHTDWAAVFLAENRAWLQQVLGDVRRARAARPELDVVVPERIDLEAAGESWAVSHRYGDRATVTAVDGPGLRVRAPDAARARAALRRWLSRRARELLVPWLQTLSRETGLRYARVSVRAQKTRWGSCSARAHISLNRNLLFLPRPVVRYLLIHELCHTVYLNHSPAYWALVAGFEPAYKQYDRVLHEAGRWLPLWAVAGR